MKKIFTAIALAALILSPAAINAQSGKGKTIVISSKDNPDKTNTNLLTKTYKISDLRGVRAGSIFEVEVVKGGSGRITVSAPEKTLEHIIVSESSGVLVLRVENGYNFNSGSSRWLSKSKSLKGPVKVVAELSALQTIDLSGAATLSTKDNFSEKLCRIDLSGASKARLNKLSANEMFIDASGASELVSTGSSNIIKIDGSGASKLFLTYNIEKLDADISGATKLNIKGAADQTVIDASGASSFDGESFQAKTVKVDLSGAAKTDIGVKKAISGEVSGASSLVYRGDPDKVILEKSRGASVSRK